MTDVFIDPNHRQLGLESDLNNPNFVGARNPDDGLFVQFYVRPWQNNFLTQQEQRPVFEDKLFVRIESPGHRNSIIDTFAREDHKRRFPRQWAAFERAHGNETQQIGTPLSQWPFLSASRVEELKFLKFHTVEQVALASDAALKNIGMTAGIDPFQFRERAKRYLEAAHDDAVAQRQAEEIKRREEEIEALKKSQAEANEKHDAEMTELKQLVSRLAEQPARRKPGRPRKNAGGADAETR